MENKKLPNATLILIFGLLSVMTCWILIGLVFAIIAVFLLRKEMKLFQENPSLYSNYHTLVVARVLIGIGFFVNLFYLLFVLFVYNVIGINNMDSFTKNLEAKKQYLEQQK